MNRPSVPRDAVRLATAAVATLIVIGCTTAGPSIPAVTSAPVPTLVPTPTLAPTAIPAPTSANATETEFKIALDATTGAAGSFTFHVKNAGTVVHEFVVIRSDIDAAAVPMASDGTEANEDAPGLTAVDEIEDLAPGTSKDLTVNLQAGHYILLCNIAGHYSGGMHTDFNVGG